MELFLKKNGTPDSVDWYVVTLSTISRPFSTSAFGEIIQGCGEKEDYTSISKVHCAIWIPDISYVFSLCFVLFSVML